MTLEEFTRAVESALVSRGLTTEKASTEAPLAVDAFCADEGTEVGDGSYGWDQAHARAVADRWTS